MKTIKQKGKGIDIPITFETAPQEKLDLKAYAFDTNGEMLAKTKVSQNKAHFELGRDDAKNLRFFISPDFDKAIGERSVSVETLEKMGAYEPVLRFNGSNKANILPIPDYLTRGWFMRKVRVVGEVIKAFNIDGIMQDKPICQARVHICEVDRVSILIPRLPDYVIEKFRDLLLYPIPIPEPDPGPIIPDIPQPRVIPGNSFAVPNNFQRTARVQRQMISSTVRSLEPEIKANLLSADLNVLRNTLVENFRVFHPIFCLYPWTWRYLYRCTEMKLVTTDANGRFDTCIWYSIFGDKPDLYFWVEVFIDGVWTSVYRPNIPCNTYWNYESGKEVTIRVKDERVRYACMDVIPGQVVWMKRIGMNTNLNKVQQSSALTNIGGQAFNQIGLTKVGRSDGKYVRPFARTLHFWAQFGSGFPSTSVKHFRVMYRKIRNSNLTLHITPWQALNNPISKPYTVEILDGDGDTKIVTRYHALGPVGSPLNPMYKIPPVSPKGSDVANDSSAEWDQDTLIGAINTSSLDDGLYQFRFELLNNTGTAQNVPVNTYLMSSSFTAGDSVNVEDEPAMLNRYLDKVSGTPTKAEAYQFLLRIDNNVATAETDNVSLNGLADTSGCGFLDYDNINLKNVRIKFEASHPSNFATYTFHLAKGNATSEAPDTNLINQPMVLEDSKGYTLGGDGKFSQMFSPSELMGSCTRAAFASVLRVYGLHTNGTSRINAFDGRDDDAFALSPKS